MRVSGLQAYGTSTERAAINTVTNPLTSGSKYYESDTGFVYSYISSVWNKIGEMSKAAAAAPLIDASIAVARQTQKIENSKYPLIRAPLWAITTAYVAGVSVVRHSNGELMACVVSGTSLGAEPAFSATALIAEAAGPSWAAMGRTSRINADGYQVPTITVNSTIPTSAVTRNLFSTTAPGKAFGGAITAGSGYVDGTYTNVPLTGGTGTGATLLSITVSGGGVTAVKISAKGTGTGYVKNDSLTCANTFLGGSGSGFAYVLSQLIQAKSTLVTQIESQSTIALGSTYGRSLIFNDGGSSSPAYVGYRVIEFMSDDPNPGIVMNTMAANSAFLVTVDGYPLEENVTPLDGTSPCYYKISWNGVRKLRKYRVETTNLFNITGIALLAQSILTPLPKLPLKAVYIGDSYGYTISTYTQPAFSNVFQKEVYRRIGINGVRTMAIGGTGYITGKTADDENTSSTKYNCLACMIANPNTDYTGAIMVSFFHSLNDVSATPEAAVANAILCWKLARYQYPNAVISIFGPWAENSNPSANNLLTDTQLNAAFLTWNDPLSFYHSISQDVAGSWTTGTGQWGTTTGTGNADYYLGADGTHPSLPGKEFLLRKVVDFLDADLVACGM